MARLPASRLGKVAAVLAVGVLLFAGLGYAAATAITSTITRIPVVGLSTGRPANQGGMNILLIGSDDRSQLSAEERKRLHVGQGDYGKNTDSMMILHLANDGSVGIVSIPRDSYVDIPSHTGTHGVTTPASKQKINAAYALGGPSLVIATVEQNTGVRIDHFAEINFAGFVSMVDALGGVPVCIRTPIKDEKAGLHLKAGEHTLDGAQALGYVRARYFDPTADLGRMKRQQEFIAALFKRATSPVVLINPPRILAFMTALASSLTVDDGFSNQEVWNVVTRMRTVTPTTITFQTIPIGSEQNAGDAGDVVVWDPIQAQALFAKLRTGAPLATAADNPATTVSTAPSDIKVTVLNGSDVAGLGARAAADLAAAGYVVSGSPSNSTEQTGSVTVIEYDPRYDESVKTLQAAFPDAQFKEVEGLGSTFRITVGSDYNGVAPVKVKASATPSTSGTKKKDPCG